MEIYSEMHPFLCISNQESYEYITILVWKKISFLIGCEWFNNLKSSL